MEFKIWLSAPALRLFFSRVNWIQGEERWKNKRSNQLRLYFLCIHFNNFHPFCEYRQEVQEEREQ